MTLSDPEPAPDHPWYLDLMPDPAVRGQATDALEALRSLVSIGAVILSVHVEETPSLADVVAGRCYMGWRILVPGSVEREAIDRIAATARPAFLATVAPGHPMPPVAARSAPSDEGLRTTTPTSAAIRQFATPIVGQGL